MKRLRCVGVLVFVAIIFCLCLWRLRNREVWYAVGQEVMQDDFGFTVNSVEHKATIHGVKAKGDFIILHLTIENHAKRVDFTFEPDYLLLTANGVEHVIDSAGQSAWGKSALLPTLAAGQGGQVDLVFDVPKGAKGEHLEFRFGGTMGETFDAIFVGKKRIRL